MNIKKALAVAIPSGLSVSALFAQDSTPTIDTTAAGNAVGAVGTAVQGLLTGPVMENVLLILGAGLAIGMIFLGVRWILKGGKTAAK